MARGDAAIRVYCDGECGEAIEINLTALARSGSWDERNVESALKAAGWVEIKTGDMTYCADCAREDGIVA